MCNFATDKDQIIHRAGAIPKRTGKAGWRFAVICGKMDDCLVIPRLIFIFNRI